MKIPAALSKIRVFVVDRTSGSPVGGVTVRLDAEVDGGALLPIGVLRTDHVGYASFVLPTFIRQVSLVSLWLTPIGAQPGKVDLLKSLQPKPTDGTTSSTSNGVMGSMRSSGLETGAAQSYCFPFTVTIDAAAMPQEECGSSTLPAVQQPDTCDYQLSPRSFVSQAQLRLGDDCCEALVPSATPAHEYALFRVITRAASVPGKGDITDAIGRGQLPKVNPVDVTKRPGTPPPSLRFGEVLNFRQRWYPLGHSLGEIKYSLALAPGEAVEIAVIDWARQDSASRSDSVSATEYLKHDLNRERSISETVSSMLTESQDGWSVMGGTAGAASGSYGTAIQWAGDHSVGGAVAHSSGERNLEGESLQGLNDHIVQASASVRSLNSTVIVQAAQGEQNALQTRRVANHNHCHALTVQYYEVLRHYRISTEFLGREKALLVPFVPFDFSWSVALRFEVVIREVVLDEQVLVGFDAIKRLHFGSSLYGSPTPPAVTTPTPTGPTYFTGSKSVTVSASTALDTQAYIQKGSTVRTVASGRIKVGGLQDIGSGYDADGSSNAAGKGFYAKGLNQYSLVARVGATNWYQGGTNAEFVTDVDGFLVLQVNDEVGALSDNSNSWSVTVQVIAPPAVADNTVADPTPVVTPPSDTQPTSESDAYWETRLIQHLSANRGYYNSRIWVLMDSSDLRMMLEAALAGFPEVLSAVDTTPLAISGNYVAFGYDGAFPDWQEQRGTDPALPLDTIVTLPTRGVFAEAMLGHCNACEKRDITRMWDWTVMTTEEPPAIADVTPGPRGSTPDLTPASLPANVIQITQPPAAPDPTGLAAALSVIGKPGIFRDMSGLQEVGTLLDTLAKGAVTSLAGAQQLAAQAKSKLDQVQQQNSTGSGAGSSGAGSSATQTPQEQLDNLQVAKEVAKAADSLGLTGADKKAAVNNALAGTRPSPSSTTGTGAGSAPSTGSSSGGTTQLPGSDFFVTTIPVVVKSYIGEVGSHVGTAPCGTGGISPPQLLLNLFATATDGAFSENPLTDELVATKNPPTKNYRLFSRALLSIVHDGQRISSASIADFTTDAGREASPQIAGQYAYLEGLISVVTSPIINQTGSNLYTIDWEVQGRPPPALEPGFTSICPRTSVNIWHRVSVEVSLSAPANTSGTPAVSRLSLVGSQFPTHRAFVDGTIITTVPQGDLANLWTPDPADPTRVK